MIDELLAAVRRGRSAALLVHGEAGIGKTALLEYTMRQAPDWQVARCAGIESEVELAFGGLHQLCAPFLDQLDRLPGPQRDALGTAFGLIAGDPPDRFLVGLAVLNLLSNVGTERPLLCLVDDVQWLDRVSVQTLAFVARRVRAEPIALIFASRELISDHPLAGLQQLELRRLRDHDARTLLARSSPGVFDDRVRDRIVAESGGNPLAVLELHRGTDALDIAGGLLDLDARPMPGNVEQGFVRRIQDLPTDTQRLLLIASAEPVGEMALLQRAGEIAGIEVSSAIKPAVEQDLIKIGSQVRFRHPLVRSAAYRAGSFADRRDAHRVLAQATDAATEPDRHTWHLACAAAGPDEAVAVALESSAERARARGGLASAAAFLERAAELSLGPSRPDRIVAAAEANFFAGAFAEALELLDAAELAPLDALTHARADLIRGQILFAARSASAGLPVLLAAAQRLQTLDPALARATYRDAIYAALTAGQLPGADGLEQVAAAVRSMPASAHPLRSEELLEGLARVTTDGYPAGVGQLLRAVAAYRDPDIPLAEELGWLPLASRMAHNAWDFDSWSVLSDRLVTLAREAGAFSVLGSALLLRLSNRMYAGDLAEAAALSAEAMAIGEATGSSFLAHYGRLVLEPWRGDESTTRKVIELITGDLALSGEGKVSTATEWAAAVLYNGLGRYEEALAAAHRGSAHPQELGLSTWSMVELVEAAAHLGRPDAAAGAISRIREMAEASGTDWALGTLAGALAQIERSKAAEALFRDAV
ncbi:MAG TPA: AAA family ATPase, partial [Microlunatus sp.]